MLTVQKKQKNLFKKKIMLSAKIDYRRIKANDGA